MAASFKKLMFRVFYLFTAFISHMHKHLSHTSKCSLPFGNFSSYFIILLCKLDHFSAKQTTCGKERLTPYSLQVTLGFLCFFYYLTWEVLWLVITSPRRSCDWLLPHLGGPVIGQVHWFVCLWHSLSFLEKYKPNFHEIWHWCSAPFCQMSPLTLEKLRSKFFKSKSLCWKSSNCNSSTVV